MAIWFQEFSVDDLNSRGKDTIVPHLGIEFTEVGDDYLVATMPVDHRTVQPLRIVHGGSSCVLAETLGSVAANMVLDRQTQYAVGLEINANHIRPAREGKCDYVTGICKPLHIGRTTQVWEIKLTNPQGKLTCVSRLTVSVQNRRA